MKRAPHTEGQKAFGKKVREIRKAKGLSQLKLAHLVDIELSTLNRIELGKAGTSLATIFALSEILEVPPKAFFEFEIAPKGK